jgi:hypothetical protein
VKKGAPKKKQQRDAVPETKQPLICARCGWTFDDKDGRGDFTRDAKGAVHCASLKMCRRRLLDAQAASRGVLDLYSKHWRDTLIQRADPKPPKPPNTAPADVRRKWEAWQSPLPPDDRVIAALELFTWCWPANCEYALQLDADDNPMTDRRTGQYVHHTHSSLSAWLGMERANVVRSLRKWERRKRVRHDDDGRMYLVEIPNLNDDERADLLKRADWADFDDVDLKIPPRYERPLREFLLEIGEEAGIAGLEKAKAIRQQFNDDLKRIRKEQDDAFNTLLAGLAAATGRTWAPRKRKGKDQAGDQAERPMPAASTEAVAGKLPSPVPPAYPEPTPAARKSAELAALHAAGHGKGALGALPRPRPVLVDRWPLTGAELENQGWVLDDRGLALFVQPCREARDCTDAELATAVSMKARFARKKDFPVAYLRTLVVGLLESDRTYAAVQREMAKHLADPAVGEAALETTRRDIEIADRHDRYCERRATDHLANLPAEDLAARRAEVRATVKKQWGHLPKATIAEMIERQLVRSVSATLGLPTLAEFAERPEFYETAERTRGAGGGDG